MFVERVQREGVRGSPRRRIADGSYRVIEKRPSDARKASKPAPSSLHALKEIPQT